MSQAATPTHYSIAELIKLKVPGLPSTDAGIRYIIKRDGWKKALYGRYHVPLEVLGRIKQIAMANRHDNPGYTINEILARKIPQLPKSYPGLHALATRNKWQRIDRNHWIPSRLILDLMEGKPVPENLYSLQQLADMKLAGFSNTKGGWKAFAKRHKLEESDIPKFYYVSDTMLEALKHPQSHDSPMPNGKNSSRPRLGLTIEEIVAMNIRGYPKSRAGLAKRIKQDGWERVTRGEFKPPATFKSPIREHEYSIIELLSLRLRCLPSQHKALCSLIESENWEPGLKHKTYRVPKFVLDAIQANDVRNAREVQLKPTSPPDVLSPAPTPTIALARERQFGSKAKFLRMRQSIPIRYLDDHFDPILEGDRLLRHINPPMTFSSNWIKNELDCPTGDIALARMPDASQEPIIKRGGFILIQYSITSLDHGKFYAFRMNGGYPFVKQVAIDANNRITLKAQNPSVPDLALADIDHTQVTLLGQVVWVGGKL